MRRLEGKIAVITGGARGMGKGCALLFAKEGADIAIGDTNLSGAEKVAERVRKTGRNAIAIGVDITKSLEVEKFVNAVINRFGRADILVNTVGINPQEHFLEINDDLWDKVITVNLKGAFHISQAVAREMAKQKKGKIINISSISSDQVTPNSANYSASKAGLNSLTKCMAIDLALYNINVNAIAPTGTIDLEEGTAMGRLISQKILKEMRVKANQPSLIRQIGFTEDIAKVALFLASDDSDFVTGQVIAVDGGISVKIPEHPSWGHQLKFPSKTNEFFKK